MHRWLIVHSEELRKAASERLQRHLSLREKELGRQLSRLSHKTFACRADAFQAAEAFAAEHLEKHQRLDDPQIELGWLATLREDDPPRGPARRDPLWHKGQTEAG